jgi:hypothetical protein
MSVLGFTVAVALALGCAYVLSRVLSGAGDLLWRVFSVVSLFAVVVTTASLIAGLGGFLHSRGLSILLAVCAVGGGGYLLARRALGGPSAAAAGSPRPTEPSDRLELAVLAVGLIACFVPLWLLARELLLGPCGYAFDDYSYHGLMIGHWLQRDELYLAPAKYQAYYPAGGELFSAFFIELGGGDAFTSLASLYWALLATLSFAVAASALGTSRGGMLVAAGLWLCSPVVAQNLGTIAAVDFAGSAAALATIAAGLTLAMKPAEARTHHHMLMVALLGGVAVGTKIMLVVLVAPVVVACCVIAARRQPARLATLVLCALLGALSTGGYWYIRNVVVTGNPLFPAEVLFFDGPLDGVFQRSTSLLRRVLEAEKPSWLARIWRDLFGWPVALSWVAGLGLGYALFVAPFMRKDARRWLLPFLALITCACFWAVFSGPYSGSVNTYQGVTRVAPRMFLPVMLPALLLAGAAIHRAASKPGRWLSALATGAGAVLIGVLVQRREHVAEAVAGAAGLVALWWVARALSARSAALTQRRYVPWIAGSLISVACVAALASPMGAQQPKFDRENRGWLDGALKGVPAGSRIALLNVFSYYAFFGARFELDPFRVDEDSKPYPMLHIEWQQNPNYSWSYEAGAKWKPATKGAFEANNPVTGWRAIEDKDERKRVRDLTILEGLLRSDADYVGVVSYKLASLLHGAKPKERKTPFSPVVELLEASPDWVRVRKKKDVMLYKRTANRPSP